MPHAIHYLMRSNPGSTSILLPTKIIPMSLFNHDSPSTAREMCASIFINSGFSLSCIKIFGSVFHNYFHVLAIGGFWILRLPATSSRREADTRLTYNHTSSDPILWPSSYPQSVTSYSIRHRKQQYFWDAWQGQRLNICGRTGGPEAHTGSLWTGTSISSEISWLRFWLSLTWLRLWVASQRSG